MKNYSKIFPSILFLGLVGGIITTTNNDNVTMSKFIEINKITSSNIISIKAPNVKSTSVNTAGWFSQIFGRDKEEGVTMVYTDTDGCTVTSVETIGSSWLWGNTQSFSNTVNCN